LLAYDGVRVEVSYTEPVISVPETRKVVCIVGWKDNHAEAYHA
jgi:hypothetical protein